MSKRYEFLEDAAQLIEGHEFTDEFGDDLDNVWGTAKPDRVALVLGNPWATAGVLVGTRESIAATLREWLALIEGGSRGGGPDGP